MVYEKVFSGIRPRFKFKLFGLCAKHRTATRDNTATRYDEPRHNWSWIGLLGLVGLAGLRPRKSESAQRFESRGVKVHST